MEFAAAELMASGNGSSMDRFKNINDSACAGDAALKVARRIGSSACRRIPLPALAVTRFVVVLPCLDQGQHAELIAGKLHELPHDRIRVAGHELVTTPSIGISPLPNDGVSADALLRNADAAMYAARTLDATRSAALNWR